MLRLFLAVCKVLSLRRCGGKVLGNIYATRFLNLENGKVLPKY